MRTKFVLWLRLAGFQLSFLFAAERRTHLIAEDFGIAGEALHRGRLRGVHLCMSVHSGFSNL